MMRIRDGFELKQARYQIMKSAEILFNKKTEDRINTKVPYRRLVAQVADFAQKIVAHKNIVISMVFTADTMDEYTIGHSLNVCMLSVLIAHILGYKEERMAELATSALLHDIGKREIPSEILFKGGGLSDKEFEIMKTHPQKGYDFMERVYPEASDDVKKGILEHHERMDYKGYPKGIGWYDISNFARIIAIADVYEAVTSLRAYHDKNSIADGVDCIRNTDGLDKNIVDLFTANTVFYPSGMYVVLSDKSVAVVSENSPGDIPVIAIPESETPVEVGNRSIIDILPSGRRTI